MTLHPACIPALGPAFSALIRRSSSSDTSAEVLADTSPEASGDTCGWCGSGIRGRRDARWCSRRCRQAAFRCRRLSRRHQLQATPLRMAYADPPYPGLAYLYRGEPSFAGEVDHKRLLDRLATYDGWALSTGAYALREVLPLCPAGVRVCAWVKPIGVSSRTWGLHNTWEPLIVSPARHLRPGKRDWIAAQPARGGGSLLGRKPLAFCAWLFEVLGAAAGDTLDDLFPGTGIVGRAWREWQRSVGRS